VAATISSLWISWSDVFSLDATPPICSENINMYQYSKNQRGVNESPICDRQAEVTCAEITSKITGSVLQ
jgi:hypothetical protein